MPQDTRLPAPEPVTPRAGLLARLRAEVRRHAIAYAVVLAFLVIGPVLAFSKVDFDLLIKRLRTYLPEEQVARERFLAAHQCQAVEGARNA